METDAEMQVKVKLHPSSPPHPRQELRSWEEKLTQAALQQKCQEEALRRREQELAEREIHILERELNIIIHQLYRDKPHVERRQGKFRRHRLKLKDGNRISLPSGETGEGGGGPRRGQQMDPFLFIPLPGWFLQISSTKSRFRRLRRTSGAGVCSAAVPALRPVRPCCPASGPSSVSADLPSPLAGFRPASHLLYAPPPAVTPREGCMAWCRSAGLQQEDEEDERRGCRKKGRSRRGDPYREHSADARYGARAWRVGASVSPRLKPKQFFFASVFPAAA